MGDLGGYGPYGFGLVMVLALGGFLLTAYQRVWVPRRREELAARERELQLQLSIERERTTQGEAFKAANASIAMAASSIEQTAKHQALLAQSLPRPRIAGG
ncbi:MAG: hypothetical protein AB7O32_00105 [Vicinamibacterales bacterium]